MSADVQRRRVIGLIGRVIAPDVGETIASTAGEMHCQRLGLVGESLTSADVDTLLVSLERGLTVFLGDRGAAKAVARVRRAVEAEGGNP